MEAALQQLYVDVFGSDSDADEYDSHSQRRATCEPGDRPAALPGLTLQKGALSVLQQATILANSCRKRAALQVIAETTCILLQDALLKTLEQIYFCAPGANQAMCFGSLPPWAMELVSTLQRHSLLSPVRTASVPLRCYQVQGLVLSSRFLASLVRRCPTANPSLTSWR